MQPCAHGWSGSPPDCPLVQSKRNQRVRYCKAVHGKREGREGGSRQGLAGLTSNLVMMQWWMPESVAGTSDSIRRPCLEHPLSFPSPASEGD